MKRKHREYEEVSQLVADEETMYMHNFLHRHGVARFGDLPEEAKVRLVREVQGRRALRIPKGLRRMTLSERGNQSRQDFRYRIQGFWIGGRSFLTGIGVAMVLIGVVLWILLELGMVHF